MLVTVLDKISAKLTPGPGVSFAAILIAVTSNRNRQYEAYQIWLIKIAGDFWEIASNRLASPLPRLKSKMASDLASAVTFARGACKIANGVAGFNQVFYNSKLLGSISCF